LANGVLHLFNVEDKSSQKTAIDPPPNQIAAAVCVDAEWIALYYPKKLRLLKRFVPQTKNER
jgi:hypothetical protein